LNSLTIATPFYNEQESLKHYFETIEKISKLLNNKINIKFLFIDDGSTDETKQKLFEYKKKKLNQEIKIHCHDKNYGYGRTLKNSIDLSDTDYLITYDSDCTYDYRIINTLVEKMLSRKYDIINVSYKLSDKKIKLNPIRKILSWGGTFIYKIFFSEIINYDVKVFTCSFRIYDLKKVKDITLSSDDFNCCSELMIKSMIKKLKIIEIPGENIGRKFGYSKMKIIKNIYNTFKTIFIIKIKG
jgi:glycosyltransferase involved in cell wall biosynthesis